MEMKKTRNILMAEFISVIAIALLIVVLYECDVLGIGILATSDSLEFIFTTVMEIITLVSIPSALRMFRFGKVRRALSEGKEKALKDWGTLRIMLLGIPLVVNTLLYYLFMATTFGYMAIILLLCMPFIYPALGKCNYEVSVAEGEE